YLALAVDKEVGSSSSICRWDPTTEKQPGTFARQALPMVWDFSEANVFSKSTGSFSGLSELVAEFCESNSFLAGSHGQSQWASAPELSLPDDSASALVTDPPYYDAVPYA